MTDRIGNRVIEVCSVYLTNSFNNSTAFSFIPVKCSIRRDRMKFEYIYKQ